MANPQDTGTLQAWITGREAHDVVPPAAGDSGLGHWINDRQPLATFVEAVTDNIVVTPQAATAVAASVDPVVTVSGGQTFTAGVVIDGNEDVAQFTIQGHTTQTQPLQIWENSAGDDLARLAGDGRLQIGDLGLATPDALIEVHRDDPSSKPKRGWHSLGKIGALATDVLSWAVHELEILGGSGLSGLQRALQAKLTLNNSGDVSAAELRAADFEAVNQSGTTTERTGQMTGVHIGLSNEAGAFLDKAVGLEIAIDDQGTTTDGATYAIHADGGVVHLEAEQELKLLSAAPSVDPPAGFVKVYPKTDEGVPRLFALDENSVERELSGPQSATVQTTDATQTDIATIALAEGEAVTVRGIVAAAKNDLSAACGGDFTGVFRRASGGNVTLVGSLSVNVQEDSGGSPTFTLIADTGNQTVDIRVTGVAAETWDWLVRYEIARQ